MMKKIGFLTQLTVILFFLNVMKLSMLYARCMTHAPALITVLILLKIVFSFRKEMWKFIVVQQTQEASRKMVLTESEHLLIKTGTQL